MYKMLFRLAVTSGARQGEILGLKWPDIDFECSQIEINSDLQQRQMVQAKVKEFTAQDRYRAAHDGRVEALAGGMPAQRA